MLIALDSNYLDPWQTLSDAFLKNNKYNVQKFILIFFPFTPTCLFLKIYNPEAFSVIMTEGFFPLAFWKGDVTDFIAVISELNNKSCAAVLVPFTDVIKASEYTRDQTHQEV